MTDCEICGKKAPKLTEITIDSANFKVCKACASFGPTIQRAAIAASPKLVSRTPYIVSPGPEFTLDTDYPKIIKEARVKCNMSQEDLAKALSEKESVIHRLETGKLNPSLSLARKLERFLRIKLVELEA